LGVLIGFKELVFDTYTACEQIDIPDAPARAFRDDRGTSIWWRPTMSRARCSAPAWTASNTTVT
jgi:hypothetical protein